MTTIVNYKTIAGTTVTIEADGRAYITAELRNLALLLQATADELDARAKS
jgi:hypothetical protein